MDHTQEYEEGFEILSNAITVIFQKQARELSYELLYRTAYKLTIRQFGERLYHDVEKVIVDYLETTAEQAIVPAFTNTSVEASTADEGASFLKTVKKVWDDFKAAIDLILQVLYYLVCNIFNTEFLEKLIHLVRFRMIDYQNTTCQAWMKWGSTCFVIKSFAPNNIQFKSI